MAVLKHKSQWWKGEITIKYDLKKIALVLLTIVAICAALAAIYYIGVGIWAVLKFIGTNWLWFAGAGIVILILYLLSKCKFKAPKMKMGDKTKKWLKWFLAIIAIIVIALLCFKSCDSSVSEDETATSTPVEVVIDETYYKAFDRVVVARAYLDGVQNSGEKSKRALVGLKYINGKAAVDTIFEGKTYEEAKTIVANEWKPIVLENLTNQALTEEQMAVVILVAMRNGKYGFQKSDFLKEVNNGNKNAEKFIYLHKANGEKRILKEEAKQYIYMLRLLWNGNITTKNLLDMPSHSYRGLSVGEIYTKNGDIIFNDNIHNKLQSGENKTPKEALELF